jgi:hypothetical protein
LGKYKKRVIADGEGIRQAEKGERERENRKKT